MIITWDFLLNFYYSNFRPGNMHIFQMVKVLGKKSLGGKYFNYHLYSQNIKANLAWLYLSVADEKTNTKFCVYTNLENPVQQMSNVMATNVATSKRK